MRNLLKDTVHTHHTGRLLVVFVAHERHLFHHLRSGLHKRQRQRLLHRECIQLKRLTLCCCDTNLWVKLREHLLHKCPKTIHHAQHTDHSRSNHPYRRRAHARDDIDGIMPFLREEVAPSDVKFRSHCFSSSSICSILSMVSSKWKCSSGMIRN